MSEKRPQSIYRSPEIKARLMAIYQERLEKWPVPYESLFVRTLYGRVHILASGPEEAPVVFLLPAGSMSCTMWLPNIEGLNRHYRTYALDYLGEPGQSTLDDLASFPQDGPAISRLFVEIAEALGVAHAYLVGASYGAYVALNTALNAPRGVNGIAVIAPIGLAPPRRRAVLKLMLLPLFPTKRFKDHVFEWVVGSDPRVLAFCGEWVRLTMEGVEPRTAPTQVLKPAELQSLLPPMLVMLGTRDRVVSEPQRVKPFALQVRSAEIDIVDAGHLMSIERPNYVTDRIVRFFEECASRSAAKQAPKKEKDSP
jgi:pimeloyl-ACP methyl ester carboxylesterase